MGKDTLLRSACIPVGVLGEGCPLGESIHLVVHHDVGDVLVSAHGVGHVAAADGEPVAVAADGDDGQIGIGGLYALSRGQSPSVHDVQTVGVDELGQPAGTTDTGHDDHVPGIQVALC